MQQTYSINGRKIDFRVEQYLSQSKGISRDNMPQIKFDQFLKLLPEIQKQVKNIINTIPVDKLKPTQNEINFDKVLGMIVEKLPIDDLSFICSNDYHIMDGHHRHVQALIQNPKQIATCYIFPIPAIELISLLKSFDKVIGSSKDIDDKIIAECMEILESYGTQGPTAVPGIGAVELGTPDTAELGNQGTKGSGDIPGGTKLAKQKRDEEDEEDEVSETGSGDIPGTLDDEELVNELNNLVSMFGAKIAIMDGKKYMSVQTSEGKWVNWHLMNEAIDYEARLKALKERRDPDGIEEDIEYGPLLPITERFLYAEELREIADLENEEGGVTKDKINEIHKKYDTIEKSQVGEAATVAKTVAKMPKNNKPLKLHFLKDQSNIPELGQCVNLPIIRKMKKIDEAFSCETMEGITHGKAGDYLMQGVDGEIYPCDSDIFHKTYQIVEADQAIQTDENGVALLQTPLVEMLLESKNK